jgi:hypothetical protein
MTYWRVETQWWVEMTEILRWPAVEMTVLVGVGLRVSPLRIA